MTRRRRCTFSAQQSVSRCNSPKALSNANASRGRPHRSGFDAKQELTAELKAALVRTAERRPPDESGRNDGGSFARASTPGPLGTITGEEAGHRTYTKNLHPRNVG